MSSQEHQQERFFPPYDCDGGRAGLGPVEVRDQGPEPLRFRVGQLGQLGQALVHAVETARTREMKIYKYFYFIGKSGYVQVRSF